MAMNKNGYGCVLALWMVRGCRSFVCLCYCQLVALAGCVDGWGDFFIGERVVSSRFLSASHCVKGSRAAGHQPRMPVVWIDFPVLRAKVFSFMVPLHGQVPSAHRGKAQVFLHADGQRRWRGQPFGGSSRAGTFLATSPRSSGNGSWTPRVAS